MLDCNHRPTLISGRCGSGDSSRVTVCLNCGQFDVTGDKGGVHFSETFELYGSYELLAASQAYRLAATPDAESPQNKRIWRPLDLAQQRLYHVLRSWDIKDDTGQHNHKDNHIVAADSPTHAAELVEATYQKQYEADERIVLHYSQGFPLHVLQPLSWTTNGIQLLNVEFSDGLFCPGEFKCGTCQMRVGYRTIEEGPEPEPPQCVNKCGVMSKLSWRDAACEAGRVAEGWMRRARALEEAFPPDAPMPVDERDLAVEDNSVPS